MAGWWEGAAWVDDPAAKRQKVEGAWGWISEPDRADIVQWVGCTPVGDCVPGTPIVPVKTPFEGRLADQAHKDGLITDDDWFSKDDLLKLAEEKGTPIGLVVDLVNTEKYYAGFEEEDSGIEYKKFRIPGRCVPPRKQMEEIFDFIDDFVERKPGDFVAVHCTHGLNRTGFLVALYLMTRGHIPQGLKAVKCFEKARGNTWDGLPIKMDKMYLVEALKQLETQGYYDEGYHES